MDTDIAALAVHSIVIVLQLLALHFLSRHLSRVLISGSGTVAYLLLSLPGTVIHELSHYVGCLVTRTRVQEVRLFSPVKEDGQLVLGYVRHVRPRGPFSSFVIGTAPFFGGAFALWIAARLSVPGASEAMRLSLETGGWSAVVGGYMTFVVEIARAFRNLDWRAFVMLYLLVSVPTHLAPSGSDLKNAAWGIVLVAVIVSLFMAVVQSFGWYGAVPFAGALQSGIAVLAGLLTFALLCCTVVTLAISVIFRLIKGQNRHS